MNFDNPIFIFGCPRSGQTLCAAILNKHPDLFILFEKNIFPHLYRIWIYKEKKYFGGDYYAFFRRYFASKKCNILRQEMNECINDKTWESALSSYMHLFVSGLKPSTLRWGDKTPHNVTSLIQIQRCYPHAQFIFVYRNPYYIVNSLSKNKFYPASNNWLINSEVVRYYWRLYSEQKKIIKKESLLEIRYENLVNNPEKVAKRMCRFLKVQYSDQLLKPAENNIKYMVGWAHSKIWGDIFPSHDKINSNRKSFIKAHLYYWMDYFKYMEDDINFSIWHYLFVKVYVLPFRVIRYILSIFWNKQYPCFLFEMEKYPSHQNIIKWIIRLLKKKK